MNCALIITLAMLDIKPTADYLTRSSTFSNFSMLFAGNYCRYYLNFAQLLKLFGIIYYNFVQQAFCCACFWKATSTLVYFLQIHHTRDHGVPTQRHNHKVNILDFYMQLKFRFVLSVETFFLYKIRFVMVLKIITCHVISYEYGNVVLITVNKTSKHCL